MPIELQNLLLEDDKVKNYNKEINNNINKTEKGESNTKINKNINIINININNNEINNKKPIYNKINEDIIDNIDLNDDNNIEIYSKNKELPNSSSSSQKKKKKVIKKKKKKNRNSK